jgi:hypothetical protein
MGHVDVLRFDAPRRPGAAASFDRNTERRNAQSAAMVSADIGRR